MSRLVSIIIPVYNRGTLIEETLNSVILQSYSFWECILVDDGSTDETVDTVEEICSKDSRIRLYKRPLNKPKGASSCRNYGIERAKGDFFQFLDSDDLLHKNKLYAQMRIADEYDNNTLYTGKWGGFEDPLDLKTRFKYRVFSYKSFKKGIGLLDTFGLYNEFFPPHVYLIPKKLLENSGSWNEDLSNNDDAEFFTRIILNASRIVFVPEAVVYYRYHTPNNLSNINSETKIESVIRSWKLIEEHILLDNARNSTKYVKRAKANLFNQLKAKQPERLVENVNFFAAKNNFDSNYYRYLKRLKFFFE